MNCKPGELAIVVKGAGPLTACIVGKVLRVTRAVFDGEPCWEYEGPRLVVPRWGPLEVIEDEFLRPIRPGGITEEEVGELYAPKQPEHA
jgi:hypothetical protein